MARPISPGDAFRAGANSGFAARSLPGGGSLNGFRGANAGLSSEEQVELEHLRAENAQLHQLCVELEQALHESSQHGADPEADARMREYEAVLEEKAQVIRELHEQLEQMRQIASELETQLTGAANGASGGVQGPAPREDELLALSEELERERRQLQEDEQTLMDQMREMEVTMAKERAEMARQRNDLQRLQSEIRHDIERLERTGGLQSKIDNLKSKLQDATARRGASPGAASAQQPIAQPSVAQPTPLPQNKGFMGRLFNR